MVGAGSGANASPGQRGGGQRNRRALTQGVDVRAARREIGIARQPHEGLGGARREEEHRIQRSRAHRLGRGLWEPVRRHRLVEHDRFELEARRFEGAGRGAGDVGAGRMQQRTIRRIDQVLDLGNQRDDIAVGVHHLVETASDGGAGGSAADRVDRDVAGVGGFGEGVKAARAGDEERLKRPEIRKDRVDAANHQHRRDQRVDVALAELVGETPGLRLRAGNQDPHLGHREELGPAPRAQIRAKIAAQVLGLRRRATTLAVVTHAPIGPDDAAAQPQLAVGDHG